MTKLFFTVCAALILSSCTKIQTGLNFAPRVATSKIDDAFDFKSEKLTKIKTQIDADIQNSKKKLAEKLIGHIDQLEKYSAQTEISKTQMIRFFDDWADTQTAMLESFKTSADVALKDLTPKEIENFKTYSEKKYAEELDLAKDKKAFIKKKREVFVKNYEKFFDSLTKEQDQLLSDFIEKHSDYFVQRIMSRQKFSEEFYMKIKTQDLVLDTILSHYGGKRLDKIADVPLKNYLNQFFDFQVAFWKTTTEKQKTYFRNTLAGYRDELKKVTSN